MRVSIDAPVLELFPQAVVAVATVRGADNGGDDPAVGEGLSAASAAARRRLGDGPLTEHPHIAPWREAYRRFGAKPKKYPSSIESLSRRVRQGESPRRINTIVDLYNTISLRFLVPVGAEDLDAIAGDVILTRAGREEAPVRLLGESDARAPAAGEVIYRDDDGAICRRWNWKEADRTKLTRETTNAILVVEVLPPVERSTADEALGELTRLVRRHCGGTTTAAILDLAHPGATL